MTIDPFRVVNRAPSNFEAYSEINEIAVRLPRKTKTEIPTPDRRSTTLERLHMDLGGADT